MSNILYSIPMTSVYHTQLYFKNIEEYKGKYTYYNTECLFKQTLDRKKPFECYFRTMDPPERLMRRCILLIKPCKNINIDELCENKDGPFWSVKVNENKQKNIFNKSDLIILFNILIYKKNLRLRSICLFNENNSLPYSIYESPCQAFSSLNPYIINCSVIKIQYYFRKYLDKKNKIIKLYKLCMEELLYLPPGGNYDNIDSFLGGQGFLNTKINFNLSAKLS